MTQIIDKKKRSKAPLDHFRYLVEESNQKKEPSSAGAAADSPPRKKQASGKRPLEIPQKR